MHASRTEFVRVVRVKRHLRERNERTDIRTRRRGLFIRPSVCPSLRWSWHYGGGSGCWRSEL